MGWARVFVFLVFLVLGASFLATTGSLVREFKDSWLDYAALDSHLFVFFPALGIVALVAFFMPSVVFTDLYWRHIRFGRVRFLFGFLAIAVASYFIAGVLMDGQRRSYWESAPAAVAADAGEPAGCAQRGEPCLRLPLPMAIRNLRQVSRARLGLDELIRNCSTGARDALIEPARTPERRRFCLASTPLSSSPALEDDESCCKAQARLMLFAQDNYRVAATRSITSEVHALLLPLKVFFLLVVFVMSFLLAAHHKKVEKNYRAYLPQMEIGLFAGALCIMFFPLMSQGFLQSNEVLSGSIGRGPFSDAVPIISLLFMVWVLLIGLFFYRRRSDDRLVTIGRFAGILVSNIGIIKYNLLVAIFIWALGAGASQTGLIALVGACVCAIVLMLLAMAVYRPRREKDL